MQVCGFAVPGHGNLVTAEGEGFVVQGLRDVAEEVDEELEGFFFVGGGQAAVLDALGVVCDGGDDAACGAAVAGEVDAAGAWGAVFGVDEAGGRRVSWVERIGRERGLLVWSAEFAGGRVAVAVGPGGY